MILLAALTIVGNLPLLAAIVGHVRAHRIQDELDDIDRITEAFGLSWHEPTPPQPLRAVAWPDVISTSDLTGTQPVTRLRTAAYLPPPPPDWDAVIREARAWNWAVATFNQIVAVCNEYDELLVAA